MARLELPVRAFIEDFFARTFPDRDAGPGSAVSDLVIKPLALTLQPLRHELDALKVRQSITNWPYMPRESLDALAINWGYTRSNGSPAVGSVRLYFSAAADYQLDALQAVADDGVTFQLVTPVTIAASDLLRARQADGTFAFDVLMQSEGVGSRYAVAAGAIAQVRNPPAGLIRISNLEDFQVTQPDQTNEDVVTGMFQSLGLRNLVSGPSIRGPLLALFPSVFDVVIAGPTHQKMVRDLVTLPGGSAQIHVGGMADIWLNTRSLSAREATFTYVPSDLRLRLVSPEQAAAADELFSFSTALFGIEGEFAPAGSTVTDISESSGVVADEGNIGRSAFVASPPASGRVILAERDIMTGTDLFALPLPGALTEPSGVFLDVSGPQFGRAGVAAGDTLLRNGQPVRIAAAGGQGLDLGPAARGNQSAGQVVVSNSNPASAGQRSLIFTSVPATAFVGSRLVIPEAGGDYKISAITGTTVTFGRPLAEVQLTLISGFTYQLTAIGGGPPEVPRDFDTDCWLDTASASRRITAISRSASGIQITLSGSPVNLTGTLIHGLDATLADGTYTVYCEADNSSRAVPANKLTTQFSALYAGALTSALPAGSTVLQAPGIGRMCPVGTILQFETVPGMFTAQDLIRGATDGTIWTAVVDGYIDQHSVRFVPALPVEFPTATVFAAQPGTTVTCPAITPSSGDSSAFTVAGGGLPHGVGDGRGLLVATTGTLRSAVAGDVPYTLNVVSVDSAIGGLQRFRLSASPSQVRIGDTLTTSGGTLSPHQTNAVIVSVETNATHAVDAVIVKTLAPSSGGTATATFAGTRYHAITESNGGTVKTLKFVPPVQTNAVTMSASGYTSPALSDVGRAVTQGSKVGVLKSFDNASRIWVIAPNDPAADVFTVGTPVTIVNRGVTVTPTAVGSLTPTGYAAPVATGATVRQGSYTGVLLSYTGSPSYEWSVRPNSASDLFDSTSVLITVDGQAATGTLREAAASYSTTSGATAITVDRLPATTNSATSSLMLRHPTSGGLYTGGQLHTAGNHPDFSGLSAVDTAIVTPIGDSAGRRGITGTSSYALSLASPGLPQVIHPPGAPVAIPVNSPITGGTVLSVTGIGSHAAPGRALRVVYGGTATYYPVQSASSANSITTARAFPAIPAGATVDIVEAYFQPFFALDTDQFIPYRIIRPFAPRETIASGTGATIQSGLPDLSTGDQDFYQTVAFEDFSTPGVNTSIVVQSGPNANATGKPIASITTATRLVTSAAYSDSDGDVTWYAGNRNEQPAIIETWLEGWVVSASQLLMRETPPALFQHRTRQKYSLSVECDEGATRGGTYQLEMTALSQSTRLVTVDVTRGTTSTIYTPGVGFTVAAGTKVRVHPRMVSRLSARRVSGRALETFNYYQSSFMTLPVARIVGVDLLDLETLETVGSLPYSLTVRDAGLRYSDIEDNAIQILDPSAAGKPVRVRYVTDPTIADVNAYLRQASVQVVNSNYLAKRMETIVVDIGVTVESDYEVSEISSKLAAYINTLPSTTKLGKDVIVKYLYEAGLVSSVDADSMLLTATYYAQDGSVTAYTDVSSVFGSDTACYVVNSIAVTKA